MRNRTTTLRTLAAAAIGSAVLAVLPVASAQPASASTLFRSCYLTQWDNYSQKFTGVRMDYYVTNVNTTGKPTVVAKYVNHNLDPRSQFAYLGVRAHVNAFSKQIWGTYSTVFTSPDGISITIKLSVLKVNKATGSAERKTVTCATLRP